MKQKTVFLCSDCGYESPKWYGKCPSCGAWNTMSEFKPAAPSAARGTTSFVRGTSRPTLLGDIETGDEARFLSGIGELDRVLGGGAVHGSFVLVGGEPGIGKSTLLLQMCQEMCRNARVLYVSGEESLRQIKLRAARLHISPPSCISSRRPTWIRSSTRPSSWRPTFSSSTRFRRSTSAI